MLSSSRHSSVELPQLLQETTIADVVDSRSNGRNSSRDSRFAHNVKRDVGKGVVGNHILRVQTDEIIGDGRNHWTCRYVCDGGLQYCDCLDGNCLKNCHFSVNLKKRHQVPCRTDFCPAGCNPSWHGPDCKKKCSIFCKDHSCDQINGYCNNGCKSGWSGKRCDIMVLGNAGKMPFCNSADCERADDKDCTEGHFGLQCQYNCSQNCESGNCKFSVEEARPKCYKGCKANFAGIFCQEFCPSNCLYCNQSDNVCLKCTDGYYGEKCQHPCNEACQQSRCSMVGGCVLTSKRSDTYSRRRNRSTSEHCHLTNKGDCACCYSGYRSENCSIPCENCETYYLPPHKCEQFCKSGYYGTTCESACPTHCAKGINNSPLCEMKYDNVKCSGGCAPGFHGDVCNKTCSVNCSNNICYQPTGNCVYCNDGAYGPTCNVSCSHGCKGNRCHRNGTCTEGCLNTFYGVECRKKCPKDCASSNSDPLCKETDDGDVYCYTGCNAGYFGAKCDTPCKDECKICDRQTGTCSWSILNTTQPTTPVQAEAVSSFAVTLISTVILLILLIVVPVVLFLRKLCKEAVKTGNGESDSSPETSPLNKENQSETYNNGNGESDSSPETSPLNKENRNKLTSTASRGDSLDDDRLLQRLCRNNSYPEEFDC